MLIAERVATLGAMARESGMRWMLFVTGWSTGLAYTTAVIVYQLGQLGSTPATAVSWIAGCVAFIALCLWRMRAYGKARDARMIPLTQVD